MAESATWSFNKDTTAESAVAGFNKDTAANNLRVQNLHSQVSTKTPPKKGNLQRRIPPLQVWHKFMFPNSSNLTEKGRLGHRHYSTDEIIRAIELQCGSIVHIARALKCTRAMIHARAAKEPEIRAAIDDARGLLLDEAETMLCKLVEAGQMTAVIFALKTVGKHRGYCYRENKLEMADSAISSFNKTLPHTT